MKQSLTMAAYLALARRDPIERRDFGIKRPQGTLIWLHASESNQIRAMAKLGMRLALNRNLSFVLTHPSDQALPENLPEGLNICELSGENPTDIAHFLDYWTPDTVVWRGPALRPSFLHSVKQRGIPLFLVDAKNCHIENRRARFLPDPLTATLGLFDLIFAHDKQETQRLRRLLGQSRNVQKSGALLEDSAVLGCRDADLEELGEALRARPLWLAARVQPDELDAIFEAQRAINRISPRLLLILVPEFPKDAPAFRDRCVKEGLSTCLWDEGEMPNEKNDVLLAEDRRELGLFYRIAPITFLGSSLKSGFGGRNPFEPAALGSAVLYGPHVKKYLEEYSRLARSGGARIVKDGGSLAAALENLMAPDRVAAMVHAGWETVSEGAEVVDQIVEHAISDLEERGAL